MGVICVDPDRIRSGWEETGKRQKELRQQIDALRAEAGALSQSWSGDAAAQFETRVLEGLDSFEKICSDLENLYAWEDRILTVFRREEAEARALVSRAAV